MSQTEPTQARLGNYKLVRRLAVGGMGEVFLAEQETPYFTRSVAIKRALPHVAAEKSFAERLIDEARLMTRLHHGNIIHVHELQQDEGVLYMVMEYLPGLDVRSVNRALNERDERWPARLAAWVVREVCLGLDYAHKACDEEGRPLGVIHRDLSPSNILLGTEGEVKLIDFGVARARGGIHQSVAGSLQGKLAYVSPEQAKGEPLSLLTDIFSLGVTLFEMLSGQRPLEGDQDVELLIQAQKGAYAQLSSLSERCPELNLDPALCAIVDQAMALEAAERYQSADELAGALNRWLQDVGSGEGEMDRLTLKVWLEPLLGERPSEPGLALTGSEAQAERGPFEQALAELFEGRAMEEQAVTRGESGGVTVTLSVDVQARVLELESLPSVEGEGLERHDETTAQDEPGSLEASEVEGLGEPSAEQPFARLLRARYTALLLLLLSALTLAYSLSKREAPLAFALEWGELRRQPIERFTVDGALWSHTETYELHSPVEVCALRGEREACQWVTPAALRALQGYERSARAALELWGEEGHAPEARVASISSDVLTRLTQEPTPLEQLLSATSLEVPGQEGGAGAQSEQGTQGPQGARSGAGRGAGQEVALSPELDSLAEGKRSPRLAQAPRRLELAAKSGEGRSKQAMSATRRPVSAQAEWFSFQVEPREARVRCTPQHSEDQVDKARARSELSCEISAPGFVTQRLEPRGTPRLMRVKLRRFGRLNARAIPAAARLTLDGVPVDNPLRRHQLKPGEHVLRGEFQHQGQAWVEERAFTLKEGERRSEVLELKPPR